MNDHDYAIVIGVRYPRLAPLTSTLHDAAQFMEWLKDPHGGGVPLENIEPLISPEKPQIGSQDPGPTKEAVDSALRKIVKPPKTRIGRRLYFYFTGHGFGSKYNDVAMLLANAHEDELAHNLGLENYLELFHNTSYFNEVVVVLDCCRDPSPPDKTVSLGSPTLTPKHSKPPPEVEHIVILAAGYGRKAYEVTSRDMGQRTGVLTSALLNCLRNASLADGNGQYTALTIRQHLPGEVKKAAAALKARKLAQKPEFMEKGRRHIILSTPAGTNLEKVPLRIIAPPELRGDLVLYDGGMQEVARKPAADVTEDRPAWRVRLLRNQWYALRHTDAPPGKAPSTLEPLTMKKRGNVFRFPGPGNWE